MELIILFLYFIFFFGRFEDDLFHTISDHDKNREMETHYGHPEEVQPEDHEDNLFRAITEYEKKKGKESYMKDDEPNDGNDNEMKAWFLLKRKASTQKKAEWDRGVAEGRAFFQEIIRPWMEMEVQLHELGTDGLTESDLEEMDKEQEEVVERIQEMELFEQRFVKYVLDKEDKIILKICEEQEKINEEMQMEIMRQEFIANGQFLAELL